MTFMRPPPGAGFCMSGSTFDGGQITPFELASLSLRFCSPLPVVPPLPGAHGTFAEVFGRAGPGCVGAVCAAATAAPQIRKAADIAAYRSMGASIDTGETNKKNASARAMFPARSGRNQAMESRPADENLRRMTDLAAPLPALKRHKPFAL